MKTTWETGIPTKTSILADFPTPKTVDELAGQKGTPLTTHARTERQSKHCVVRLSGRGGGGAADGGEDARPGGGEGGGSRGRLGGWTAQASGGRGAAVSGGSRAAPALPEDFGLNEVDLEERAREGARMRRPAGRAVELGGASRIASINTQLNGSWPWLAGRSAAAARRTGRRPRWRRGRDLETGEEADGAEQTASRHGERGRRRVKKRGKQTLDRARFWEVRMLE